MLTPKRRHVQVFKHVLSIVRVTPTIVQLKVMFLQERLQIAIITTDQVQERRRLIPTTVQQIVMFLQEPQQIQIVPLHLHVPRPRLQEPQVLPVPRPREPQVLHEPQVLPVPRPHEPQVLHALQGVVQKVLVAVNTDQL